MQKKEINQLKKEINLTEVKVEDLFQTKCDIISPCALGKAINATSKNQLSCRAIVGAANNQLDNPQIADWLLKNKIIYSPDYLVNSGGVIAIASEINGTEDSLQQQLDKISDRLTPVLIESKKNNESTDIVARRIAFQRIKGS